MRTTVVSAPLPYLVDPELLAEGLLPGVGLWIYDWFGTGRTCIVHRILSSRRDDVAGATGLSAVSADSSDLVTYIRFFASRAPLGMSSRECIDAGVSGCSARHFAPAMRGAFRIEEATAHAGDYALGTWAPPRHQAARSAAVVPMAVGYGGTEPQLAAGAATRLSVDKAFRQWLGNNCWEEVVPLSKGVPSFIFLLTAAPTPAVMTPPPSALPLASPLPGPLPAPPPAHPPLRASAGGQYSHGTRSRGT